MLQEVDLASLRVAHGEPISIGQFLAKKAVARVRVAHARGILPREHCCMLRIKLLHELASEHLGAHPHRNCIHSENVLEHDGEGQD